MASYWDNLPIDIQDAILNIKQQMEEEDERQRIQFGTCLSADNLKCIVVGETGKSWKCVMIDRMPRWADMDGDAWYLSCFFNLNKKTLRASVPDVGKNVFKWEKHRVSGDHNP